jgi:hypothetical protein
MGLHCSPNTDQFFTAVLKIGTTVKHILHFHYSKVTCKKGYYGTKLPPPPPFPK